MDLREKKAKYKQNLSHFLIEETVVTDLHVVAVSDAVRLRGPRLLWISVVKD